MNSIIIRGSSEVSNVVVARVDGEVSVKVQGDANVEVIYIDDGSDNVSVEGTVGNIEVKAPDIVVTAVGATIKSVDISGENSKVIVDTNSKVSTVSIEGSATNAKVEVAGTVTTVTTAALGTAVTGAGTVTKVEAQTGATGAKIETPNTQIAVGAGVTGVTGGGGTAISGGTTANNNTAGTDVVQPTAPPAGGGGGGDSTPAISVTGVSVTNATTVTFNSNVAGATIKWNGIAYVAQTVSGANSITVPLIVSGVNNTLAVEKPEYINFTKNNVVWNDPLTFVTSALSDWVTDRTEPNTWTAEGGLDYLFNKN